MRIQLGKVIKEYSKRNKNNNSFKVFSVTNSSGFIPSTEYFSKEVFSKDLSNYKIVKQGMIAYNPSRINVGSVACQNKAENVIVSPLYIVFSVDASVILPEILELFLKSNIGQKQIKSLTSGSVRDSLKFSALERIEINIPPLNIQKEILGVFSKLSILIDQRKQQLNKINQLAKSRFLEMFGDPISNSKGWEITKLEDLGELSRGISKSRPRNLPELLGGKYPLVQTGDVANSELYITRYNSTYSELGLKQSKMWKAGTLCITIAANIAKTAILKFDACFPDSIVGFKSNGKTNQIFIHYIFSFFQELLESQAPTVAQKNINLQTLQNLMVICPPSKFQNDFESFIQQLDKSKFRIKKSLEKLEMTYKALLQEYFG